MINDSMKAAELMQAKILVIDDVPANLQLFCSALADHYELQIARSGEEGLALALLEAPDLILLDIMMPGLDGFETCRRLKADPVLKDVPLIFVTALGDMDAETLGLSLGAADYIKKPITIELARLRIRNLLERESMRRQLQQALAKEQLAGNVFHHAQEGMMVCDGSNRILDVNPVFCEITGYSREEVLGRNPRMLSSERHDSHFYQDMWRTLTSAGHWSGEVWNRRKDGEVYAQRLAISTVRDQDEQLSHYVGTLSDISLLKTRHDQLERLAHYDVLTQLPNRLLFADRLEQGIAQSRRAGKRLALCYIDLDEFKPVNDRFGHEVGDQLLVEVAKVLKTAVRAEDTVARLGGDEFVVLLLGLETREQCVTTLTRIVRDLSAPFCLGQHSIRVSASIGVSLFPDDSEAPETLLRQADQAMYKAKAAGRNTYSFYTPASSP